MRTKRIIENEIEELDEALMDIEEEIAWADENLKDLEYTQRRLQNDLDVLLKELEEVAPQG